MSVAAAVTIAAVSWRRDVSEPDRFPYRLEVTDQTNPPTGGAAVSPDARTLVYVARAGGASGTPMLFARRLDRSVSRAIPGTENAGFRTIWWSPDGQSIAGVVQDIEGDALVFDFNHPLAGRAVTFDVKVISRSVAGEAPKSCIRCNKVWHSASLRQDRFKYS